MTKSNDKSRRIGGGGAKYQIWSKVECIQFEQNVIKHGWGNWRNMRIPTRTSQQIKSHAQKVKKLHKERLLREHEVANRTVDLRTNVLVGGGGDAKRKRGGKAPQASPAHKKTSTSIKVKIRGILRNSSNIVVTCSAIDKATPSPMKMITRKQIIPSKPSFDTIKIARKDNVVIATTCMLQQHRTFTPPPSPLPNSTEMEGITPLPFIDALVFDATVGAVKSPAFFDVMFPSHRYRAFEAPSPNFDEVPALSTVTTSPILKRDYSSPLARIVRKNDPGLDTVANSLESKETFTKSNIYLCRSNIQLPPNVNPDKQLFMKYHAHLTSPPDVNNPAEYADIAVDYIIGLDGISRAGIDKGELCRARIKKLLNEHLNTGWWRKDALAHIIQTTEKLSFKKFAFERLVALIAVMMNVDSWHVLPTTGKTIADNVYDDICHVGWLLSGLWKRVGRSRDGLALLNCVSNRERTERYTAIKMLVGKLDMISRQTRL